LKSFFIDIFRRNAYLMLAAFVLFLSGYFLDLYFNSAASVSVLRNSIQSFLQEREEDFEKLTRDSALLDRLSHTQYAAAELEKLVEKKYGIFLYSRDSANGPEVLRFWNDQRSLPAQSLLNGQDGRGLTRLSNGQYDYIKKTLPGSDGVPLLAIALIPVRWQYYISTSNLTPGFTDYTSAEGKVRIATGPTAFPVRSLSGNILFYLEKRQDYRAPSHNWMIPLVVLVGVLLVLILIHNIAHTVREKWGAAW
jgi:two-component system nitrogen regulation sensor histidine kinase NtrY